jgi:hypothetical protein
VGCVLKTGDIVADLDIMELTTPVLHVPRLSGEKELISLVYVSSAVQLFSSEALLDLLQQARDKNGRLGITGCCYTRAATSCRR